VFLTCQNHFAENSDEKRSGINAQSLIFNDFYVDTHGKAQRNLVLKNTSYAVNVLSALSLKDEVLKWKKWHTESI